LHQWFTWATPSAPGHLIMTMHGGVHHVVGAPPPVRHGASAGLGMLGAHAVAGMLVALWLYAGERALHASIESSFQFMRLLGRIFDVQAKAAQTVGALRARTGARPLQRVPRSG
jgi:hypothetical protein